MDADISNHIFIFTVAKMYKAAFFLVGLFAFGEAGILSDDLVKSFTSSDSRNDVIVEFPPVTDAILSSASIAGLSGNDRHAQMLSLMQKHTRAAQKPILSALSAMGFTSDQVTPFWVDNKVSIRGVKFGALQALAAIPGAFAIRKPYEAKIFPAVETSDAKKAVRQTTQYQWGVEKIGAGKAQENGINGAGIVIGVIDTGLNAKHIALQNSYKNDEYSWHDAFKNCTEPCDGHGHGSHCAGTIAGTENGIGVAPGAKIIACRGLDDNGSGSEATLLECGQFMLCPSGVSEDNSECLSGVPHAVSNSWGGSGWNFLQDKTWYNNVIKAWRAAGIIPIFAIGNDGPTCGINGSPGNQPNLTSVGATGQDDHPAYFSSRGPAGFFGSKIKPEIAAPGVDIVSVNAKTNDGYTKMSGTSMATPHVAGAVALILQANPGYKYDDVFKALAKTAVRPKLSGSERCNYLSNKYPNNALGYGRIDMVKALNLPTTSTTTPSANPVP